MPAAYKIGQKILIKPVSAQSKSIRESAIRPYAGQTGEISNFHWIEPPTGKVFYLYTVRVDNSNKEIVLYEDEIEHVSKTKSKQGKIKGK